MAQSVMLTANQARAKSRNDLAIFREVRSIEEAIITAAALGDYTGVTVTGTNMTGPADTVVVEDAGIYAAVFDTDTTADELGLAMSYFNVWRGVLVDRSKEQQMAYVIQYFTDLGYKIDRRTNVTTGDTFKWIIFW